jgi:hypothetical protein
MSSIPLPERGQPLDLSYIYEIAKTVNQLSLQSSFSANRFVSIETPAAGVGRQDIKVTESRMVAGYKEITNNTSITQGAEISFSYDFPAADFKYPPIVTASPINISGTEAGKDILVVLTLVTTSRVEGVAKFNTSGTASVGINLIAVGVPN